MKMLRIRKLMRKKKREAINKEKKLKSRVKGKNFRNEGKIKNKIKE